MFSFLRGVLDFFLEPLIRPVLKPIVRLIAGVIAVPLFRLFRQKVVHLHELDQELEKDIDQWFRASLLLLLATKNVEMLLFPWLVPTKASDKPDVQVVQSVEKAEQSDDPLTTGQLVVPTRESDDEAIGKKWFWLACRILLAVGVIEAMPDQELFLLIHPGLRRVKIDSSKTVFRNLLDQRMEVVRGLVCQHLNRSSPVLAIMCAIVGGRVGWVCYGLAITQYLIIGLVTSRNKALDVLAEFDQKLEDRRRELREALAEYERPEDGPSDDGS